VQELFHGGDSDDKGSTTSESFFSFVWRFHLSPAARLPDAADHMGLDLVGYTVIHQKGNFNTKELPL